MTRAEIVAAARLRIRETDETVVTTAAARDAFQTAARTWCRKTLGLPVSLPLTVVAGRQQYDWPWVAVEAVKCEGTQSGDTYTVNGEVYTALPEAAVPGPQQFRAYSGSDLGTAVGLAKAIRDNDETVEVSQSGPYVVVRSLSLGESLNGTSSNAQRLQHASLQDVPFRLEDQAAYTSATSTRAWRVSLRSLEALEAVEAGWRDTVTSGLPVHFAGVPAAALWLYPRPSEAGVLTCQGRAEEYALPSAATWDDLPLRLSPAHREGLVYGTALVLLGESLEDSGNTGRFPLYTQRWKDELADATHGLRRRPAALGRGARSNSGSAGTWYDRLSSR